MQIQLLEGQTIPDAIGQIPDSNQNLKDWVDKDHSSWIEPKCHLFKFQYKFKFYYCGFMV